MTPGLYATAADNASGRRAGASVSAAGGAAQGHVELADRRHQHRRHREFDSGLGSFGLLSPKAPVGFGSTMWAGSLQASGVDMVSADTKSLIERAKRIYAEQLQDVLERQHRNRFVAIEPESGEYFVADTFDEAVKSARAKHPARLSHTIWIGHRAAFHMGGMLR